MAVFVELANCLISVRFNKSTPATGQRVSYQPCLYLTSWLLTFQTLLCITILVRSRHQNLPGRPTRTYKLFNEATGKSDSAAVESAPKYIIFGKPWPRPLRQIRARHMSTTMAHRFVCAPSENFQLVGGAGVERSGVGAGRGKSQQLNELMVIWSNFVI